MRVFLIEYSAPAFAISVKESTCLFQCGLPDLCDCSLLEFAVFGINASFEDMEQYPSVEKKASAQLTYALINNYAFVDVNKQVGALAMLMILRLNSVDIQYRQQELIDFGLGV